MDEYARLSIESYSIPAPRAKALLRQLPAPTMMARVAAYLLDVYPAAVSARQIVEVAGVKAGTVRSALHRLLSAGKVERLGGGQWTWRG